VTQTSSVEGRQKGRRPVTKTIREKGLDEVIKLKPAATSLTEPTTGSTRMKVKKEGRTRHVLKGYLARARIRYM